MLPDLVNNDEIPVEEEAVIDEDIETAACKPVDYELQEDGLDSWMNDDKRQ